MKCDIETIEADLLALIKSNLAAKLSEIETEKADGLTLAVPTDAQYFDSTDIDELVINEDLLIKHGLVESEVLSISSANAEQNTYIFLIYLTNLNAPQGEMRKKLFRYIRAFKEILQENFDAFPYLSRLDVSVIAPAIWAENEQSPAYKVGGVYIQTTLAG
jgi:hypothetical protein